MGINQTSLSLRAAQLIIGYTHNTLTEKEKDELDKWVSDSDENMMVFEELTKGLNDKIFDPGEIIVETENLLELWIIAGLITRQMKNMIEPEAEKLLNEWIEASELNRRLYNSFTNPDNLQKFAVLFKQLMNPNRTPTNLN